MEVNRDTYLVINIFLFSVTGLNLNRLTKRKKMRFAIREGGEGEVASIASNRALVHI